jgi:hypothetical protein
VDSLTFLTDKGKKPPKFDGDGGTYHLMNNSEDSELLCNDQESTDWDLLLPRQTTQHLPKEKKWKFSSSSYNENDSFNLGFTSSI